MYGRSLLRGKVGIKGKGKAQRGLRVLSRLLRTRSDFLVIMPARAQRTVTFARN